MTLSEAERHGRRGTYTRGCRCDRCVEANRADSAKNRRKGTAPTHGTYGGYCAYGCRCDPCKAAGARWNHAHAHAASASQQDATVDGATKRGDEWTGAEMEELLGLVEHVTQREAARMLGRTFYGVRARLHLLRTDPKWMKAAGVTSC